VPRDAVIIQAQGYERSLKMTQGVRKTHDEYGGVLLSSSRHDCWVLSSDFSEWPWVASARSPPRLASLLSGVAPGLVGIRCWRWLAILCCDRDARFNWTRGLGTDPSPQAETTLKRQGESVAENKGPISVADLMHLAHALQVSGVRRNLLKHEATRQQWPSFACPRIAACSQPVC
jgi:hypothetical protein